MTLTNLDIANPFFDLLYIEDHGNVSIQERAIVLNLSDKALIVASQKLAPLQSCIIRNTELGWVDRAILIKGLDKHPDDDVLMTEVRSLWPTAYEVRGEDRLQGVQHYMSPKTRVGNIGFSLYHSASVPLNVGLHKEHPWCPVPGFREVHTQIAGFGKMQQCSQKDLNTLYMEELMAPGCTHRPMYDSQGNYPWHQYETITPSIFMAVEILPEGA